MTRGVRRSLLALGVVGLLAALWTLLAPGQGSAGGLLRPDDATLTARGQTLYAQHCASCHGAALEGQPNWRERGADGLLPAPPHDASGHTWHHPDALLFALTKQGVAATIGQPDYRSAMPVYAGVLSDADIVAVLSWIKSRWPDDVRRRHDALNAQAGAGG